MSTEMQTLLESEKSIHTYHQGSFEDSKETKETKETKEIKEIKETKERKIPEAKSQKEHYCMEHYYMIPFWIAIANNVVDEKKDLEKIPVYSSNGKKIKPTGKSVKDYSSFFSSSHLSRASELSKKLNLEKKLLADVRQHEIFISDARTAIKIKKKEIHKLKQERRKLETDLSLHDMSERLYVKQSDVPRM